MRRARHVDAMDDIEKPQPETADRPVPATVARPPAPPPPAGVAPKLPKEIGGAPGPEPTRYGDWQHKGRVSDF
jgi:hypothetical protein